MAYYVPVHFAVCFGIVFMICLGVKGDKVADEASKKLCILVNVKLFHRKMFLRIFPLRLLMIIIFVFWL